MKRTHLLEILQLLKPGLSSKDLVPAFACYCFSDNEVVAYNDTLGVRAKVKTGITVGIPGAPLLAFVQHSAGKDITIAKSTNDEIALKCGTSQFKISCIAREDYLYEDVDMKGAVEIPITETFIKHLDLCLVGAGADTTQESLMGVILKGKNKLAMYSSDQMTISKVDTKIEIDKPLHVVLPTEFCKALISIIKDTETKKASLFMKGEYAEASIGNYVLFGRLFEADPSIDFEQYLKKAESGNLDKVSRARMEAIFKKAIVFHNAGVDNSTKIVCSKGEKYLRVRTRNSSLATSDNIKVSKQKADVDIQINPNHILRILPYCDKFRITNDMAFFKSGGFTHIISAAG